MKKIMGWKSEGYELGVFCVVGLLVVCMLYGGVSNTSRRSSEEGRERLEVAVRRAVVQCYAIEGMYPPNIAYLKKNYGLVVNEKSYIVDYQIFASNIMPDITVFEKKWR